MSSLSSLLLISLSLWAGDPELALEVSSVVISVIAQAEVPAQQRGPLTSIRVEEGDLVEADELLATIDDADARLARTRAEIDLESARDEAQNTVHIRLAKKSLELAESELARGERSRELFRDAISDEEIEHRRLKVEEAKLRLEQAEHELRQARNKARFSKNELQVAERHLQRCRIAAPLSGVVVQVNRRAGEWVEPGDAVLRILRIDVLRAEGFLEAGLLPPRAAGMPVTLTVRSAQDAQQFTGVLKFVDPEINPVDGRVRVWAEVGNRDLMLRPGMRASMSVELTGDGKGEMHSRDTTNVAPQEPQ